MSAQRRIDAELPLDLDATFTGLWRGGRDPCMRRDGAGRFWRALAGPEGPAALRLTRVAERSVLAEGFGPGADWALDRAPDLVGANDSLEGFRPVGLVAELAHRFPGARTPRTRTMFQCLVPSVLEQKVAGLDALRSYAALTRKLSQPAPGAELRAETRGAPLFVPPPAAAIARLPSYEQRALGIDEKRGGTLVFAAKRAARIDALADGKFTAGACEAPEPRQLAEARRFLLALPGIGPWTCAEVVRVALGDPDAVSVGDFHLPNLVAYNLAGEARADDARMLELLAPFEGHRGRVVQLLQLGGRHAPRFGPRAPLRRFALPK